MAHSSDAEGVKRALVEWVRAVNAGDLRLLCSLLAADAVIAQPPAITFNGRSAIERLYRAAFEAFAISEQIRVDEIRVVGGIGTVFLTESIRLVPRVGGDARSFTVTGIVRFRRDGEGKWMLVGRSLRNRSELLTSFANLQ